MSGADPFPVIGLAGGIGSGKSAVARCFEQLGCVVSDSDAEAKAALDLPEIREQLVAWWGPQVVGEDGRVDRRRLAEIVFHDPAERTRLQSLTHPVVHARRAALMDRGAREGAAGFVIDAPLLFEAGVDAACDAVVFVEASRETRLARVRQRGWDARELERRESAQLAIGEKRRRCDFVVANEGDDLAGLCRRVGAVFREVVRGTGRTGVP